MKLLTWMSVGGMGLFALTAGATGSAFGADPEFGGNVINSPLSEQGIREAFYESEPKSDSGIRGPKYAEIVAELDALAQTYPDWVDRYQYGITLGGRPLVALKISKKTRTSTPGQRQAVLIAGSIHGNEYLNIEDRLPRWILEQGLKKPDVAKFFEQGGVALLAPILNPDGYDTRRRANNQDVDLNRDFTVRRKNHFGFKQPETKSLSEWVADQVKESTLRLSLTMDYHCCIGAVLRPWSFTGEDPGQDNVDRFDVVGRILKSAFGNKYKYGTTPEILGYSAIGTSKDYYFETYGAVGLTFEGKKNQEHKRFPEHTKMWEQIFAAINAGKI